MRKTIYSAVVFILFVSLKSYSMQKEWVSLGETNAVKCKPVLTSTSENLSEISINLPGFYKEEKITPAGNAFSITIPGGSKMLQSGMPDLPQIAFSVIIPGNAEMKAEIISSQYTDFNCKVAPSKGNLKRNVDPSQVAYVYSSAYTSNTFLPADVITLRDPYILRDFRGQAIVVHPMQYNPVTQTLRVYYSMKIKVSPTGNTNHKNTLARQSKISSVDATYSTVYQKHFLNYSPAPVTPDYNPRIEHGSMLVISDPMFLSAMQPFVDWKNRMGQSTKIVDVTSIGTTPAAIKTFIEDYYTANGLTFVLLVGDGPQIPPYPSSSGDSDPSYGYLTGNDSYPEVFVGRFSANDITELETQVQRTLKYEMNPDPNGQWYHKGVCIGSDQGPGDDNEMDFEHERNIRTDFTGYTYTQVDELYDGSQGGVDAPGDPSESDLNASLNNGRSVVTYTGHGSSSSLGTTGYSISDVSGLTNNDELPFIWSVACVNGDFNAGTCLAEAFMRSHTANGEATGAIATFMSTINQSWDPPMDGQDEMVDLLVESYAGNIKHTFGGISFNGCMHMNDQYGVDGDEMTDTWTVFGDPSLTVRTNTPFQLTVSHPHTINVNATSFSVSCLQNGALVCMSKDNQIISAAWSLAGSAILMPSSLHVGDTIEIVATAYNAIPYFSTVIVTSSTTGIQTINNTSFSLFPNPTNGKISFRLPAESGKVSMRITNSIGQTFLVNAIKDISNLYNVDMTSLSSGIYTISLYNNEGVIGTEKVVKE